MKKSCSKFCKQCDDNGNCLCENGFTGRYCQIGFDWFNYKINIHD
jgi:hypothetical protein